jgi:lipopolysaccharide export system protein LptA
VIYRPLFLAALAALLACAPLLPVAAEPAPAPAAGLGSLGLGGASHSKEPMHLKADGGIEWQQVTKSYIARNNATATRGDVTLRADTITAYYRDAAAKPGTTEIWRVIAAGKVRISTPTESVVGEVATYDLDHALVMVTGSGIRLTTPQDVVTARDSLEWYDDRQLAVARGKATVRRGDRLLSGDVITAKVTSGQGQPAHVGRADVVGHVLVSSPGQVGTGNTGVYDATTGRVTLHGHVVLVRGENTLSGEYGIVDLTNGVSRLMPQAGGHPRVQGYIVPPAKHESAPPSVQ